MSTKYPLLLLFNLLLCHFISAQDYETVDATIQLYPTSFNAPEELSAFITRDFISEEDKVRAIYTWIIMNVAYEPDEYKQFNYNFKSYRERNLKEEKTRNKIIKRTLSKGIAVCEGYAMLFERLCELQGISNYLVRGDIKTNFNDIGRPFKNTHMWNVVTIEGKSYLYDATWGAGKYHGKFIKEPNYFYYKTPPNLFAKTHCPQMPEDAFLTENLTREDFAAMPLVIQEQLTLNDIDNPKKGLISSRDGDGYVNFSLRNVQPSKIEYSYGADKKALEFSKEGEAISFVIPIELGKENLLIYFDDKPALGYKIK
ncbi:MAG: transglutaminase domain-containing protein [Bacteroidota bacterium]